MREIFNSRDLNMSANLMQSLLGEVQFIEPDIVDEDYIDDEAFRVDAMDYEIKTY